MLSGALPEGEPLVDDAFVGYSVLEGLFVNRTDNALRQMKLPGHTYVLHYVWDIVRAVRNLL